MKTEGDSRRKLSERKDPGASVGCYIEQGFPAGAIQLPQEIRELGYLGSADLTHGEDHPAAVLSTSSGSSTMTTSSAPGAVNS
jgi:hypothetical protein